MPLSFPLPFRQVHLDFHTGPGIPDVGADFDAKGFARALKAAHINSITVFAKCHHGHLYYNTKRPERHPGLKKGLDLLGEQVEALHREGIRAPIYISVQCDEYAANTHPEWIARNPDTSMVKWAGGREDKAFGAGWQILDLSTPYQDFLAEQTAEVLKLFKPVDGIFFDMCWDQPSTNPYFVAAMIKAGLNPEKGDDRNAYARTLAHQYMKRFYGMVKASSKDATVFFNSRPFSNLATEIQFQTQAEIEALPTGGWGYMYFPINVRYARTFGEPYMGMTARFHKSWADFGGIKPYAALEYEISQMLAHGARCSIGDQMHPRGTLDKASYALIGKVYERVAAREPWLEGAVPLSQVGLFQRPTGSTNVTQSSSKTDEGATRMLTQLRVQFDVVQAESDWAKYELLVLPDGVPVTDALAKKLQGYLKKGGKLLATGTSGLSADASAVVLKELGVKAEGMSPFTSTYMRFDEAALGNADGALVSYAGDHVVYDRGVRVTAAPGTEVLARVVEPYFERAWDHFCSHRHTPGLMRASKYAAATLKGNVGYVSFDVFNQYAVHGNLPYRLVVKALLERLLPEPLLKVSGPSYVEATVQCQKGEEGMRQIVHVLAYSAERRTGNLDIVEDIVPLTDVAVSLRRAKAPKRVYLAPERVELPFRYENGRVEVTIPRVAGHAMVVFES